MSGTSMVAEPDALAGTPHPRTRAVLYGHEEAEATFFAACASGRMHHAWLIGGPEGIGKATFAYRIARYMLASGRMEQAQRPLSLEVPTASPVFRQVAVLSHPNLAVLRRIPATDKKAASTTIPVDEVRRVLGLFATTAADAGYRICIVDCAEDLTPASANALLKLVEEPPPKCLFLIISHAPQRVLPTIRSRCRRLLLRPLADDAMRSVIASFGSADPDPDPATVDLAIAMSDGSARRALQLLDPDRAALIGRLDGLLRGLPRLDWSLVLSLAESLSRRTAEEDFWLVLNAVERHVSGILNKHADLGPARLAPLAEVCEKIARAAREADVYNLDRRPLVLTMFGDLAEAVAAAGRGSGRPSGAPR